MDFKTLIEKKRDGGELSAAEIDALVKAYTAGAVADCQMSAFAMAVCCRGMSAAETAALTDSMRSSGAVFDWSGCVRPVADKHSSGGVGDKLSLAIQPIAAAAGLAVPSLAGRGLGHTGGTIDTLESIPGFRADIPPETLRRLVLGPPHLCICAQTPEICPADRKLYALRDVTGTVASIPLITASILSKKLAEGSQTLVFDVKCGRGAFMKTREDACALAESLVSGAKRLGRKASALVTAMDIPLGRAVGNSLEVEEAIETLSGSGPEDVRSLSVELAARMLFLSGISPDLETAKEKCATLIDDGSALESFRAFVAAQGGDLDAFAAECRREVPSTEIRFTGGTQCHVADVDALKIAEAAGALGAGRFAPGDGIDCRAGVVLDKKPGESVSPGETLARAFSSDGSRLAAAAKTVASAFSFSEKPPVPQNLAIASF